MGGIIYGCFIKQESGFVPHHRHGQKSGFTVPAATIPGAIEWFLKSFSPNKTGIF